MATFESCMQEIEFDSTEKRTLYLEMGKVFDRNLPDILYRDHYALEDLTNISQDEWRNFLKIPSVVYLIESELALLAEIKARTALQKLGDEKINTSEVAAIKALLDKSKLLQNKTSDHVKIVFHHIPLNEISNSVQN